MQLHAFKVGQQVGFRPGGQDLKRPYGSFTIVRLLPSETRDRQYRIKSNNDGHERVALESQLSPLAAPPSAASVRPPKSGLA